MAVHRRLVADPAFRAAVGSCGGRRDQVVVPVAADDSTRWLIDQVNLADRPVIVAADEGGETAVYLMFRLDTDP